MITLTHDIVNAVDLNPYVAHITRQDHKSIFVAPAGQHHYKLLYYLSSCLQTPIVELGTHHGTGTLALAAGTLKPIYTFDKVERFSLRPPLGNIHCYLGDIFVLGMESLMLGVGLVFVDTAHKGDYEYRVYRYLRENFFTGLLLFDDISLNSFMEDMWASIDTKKYNITYLGHGALEKNQITPGTGIVDFGNNLHRPRP